MKVELKDKNGKKLGKKKYHCYLSRVKLKKKIYIYIYIHTYIKDFKFFM